MVYRLSTIRDGVAERSQLINAVQAVEAGEESGEDPTAESVKLGLHHTQLPHLEAAGIIE